MPADKKDKISITLKPIVFFPGMVGGAELTNAGDATKPSVIVLHAGSPIPVATISAKAELDKTAALMAFNFVTKKLAGSMMGGTPQPGGTVHGDSSPMTSSDLFQGIEKSFPDYQFVFDKSW